jgi:hypothetical protein
VTPTKFLIRNKSEALLLQPTCSVFYCGIEGILTFIVVLPCIPCVRVCVQCVKTGSVDSVLNRNSTKVGRRPCLNLKEIFTRLCVCMYIYIYNCFILFLYKSLQVQVLVSWLLFSVPVIVLESTSFFPALSLFLSSYRGKKKGKAIAVTGRGGPLGCETSRLPHFVDSLLTDGREIASLKRRPPSIPQEDSRYSFLLETNSTSGP